MLGHIGINVPDLDAAKRYYRVVMPLVGFEIFLDAADEFAYRPAAGKPGTYLFFYPSGEQTRYSRHQTGLQHLAFMVRTRSAVQAVHSAVAELGGRVLHEPQVFPQYPQPYFATFWLDPWGLMLEAVCHHDRE
jgi:catechol 2,3-dioxygenase-like lactoylglutathione lyase family enzyme